MLDYEMSGMLYVVFSQNRYCNTKKHGPSIKFIVLVPFTIKIYRTNSSDEHENNLEKANFVDTNICVIQTIILSFVLYLIRYALLKKDSPLETPRCKRHFSVGSNFLSFKIY